MKISEFCKMSLSPLVFEIISALYNNIRYHKYSNKSTIHKIVRKSEIISVLGNGPSLKNSVEKYEDFLKENDCLVVNYFANTELYEELKPTHYLFVDPIICLPLEQMGDWRESNEKLIENLINKTNWDLNLILPVRAENSEFVTKLKNQNKFIKIFYINTINFKHFHSNEKKFKYWNKNLIEPPAQTVMNTAIYLGLFFNYAETYAFGIDSNFFESLDLDQDTNILYNNDSHFYGNKRLPWYIDAECTKVGKLHEIAKCFVKMFELYWELRNYADYKGLKVYNASEFSMVDAFERKKPNKRIS